MPHPSATSRPIARLPLAGAFAFALAAALPAQGWAEVGDAGNLPAQAQVPAATGPLVLLTGSLAGDSADLYLIEIRDAATFTATTVGGASFDTQLWLFDLDGRGLAHCDDTPGSAQSTLTGANVPGPGKYYLGISAYDVDPIAAGTQIWNDTPYVGERAPDGPRRRERIGGWAGNATTASTYAITLTGVVHPRPQALVPPNGHLSEQAADPASGSAASTWSGSPRHLQLLYRGTELVAAGAAGPIQIEQIAFRGAPGYPSVGGSTWTGMQVRVASTSLVSLSPMFASNLQASTTTVAPLLTMDVTTHSTRGGVPNDDAIVLDLATASASFVHDPTGSRPNLLLDIVCPTAPTSPSLVPLQARASGGVGIFAVTGSATVPNGSPAERLIAVVTFSGAGGRQRLAPARTEPIGACGRVAASSFYQQFLLGEGLDLTGLRLVPDNPLAPTRYVVDGAAAPYDASKLLPAAAATGDNALLLHALGFTHRFPGGTTTQVRASMNGFVWLDANQADAAPYPGLTDLLGGSGATGTGPRYAPFWSDLDPTQNVSLGPTIGLHAWTDTSGGPGNAVCYLSWHDVALANLVGAGASRLRLQCVIHEATGVVEFRYATPLAFGTIFDDISVGPRAPLVGFGRGRIGGVNAIDPGSRDLSIELPFTTGVEGTGPGGMRQNVATTPAPGNVLAPGRAFAGQTLTWNVANVPAGALVGAQLIDIAASRPGLVLPGIMAPGTSLGVTTGAVLWEVAFLPGSTVTGTRALAIPPGVEGLEVYAQYVLLDGLFGGPNLITATSNTLRHEVGWQ